MITHIILDTKNVMFCGKKWDRYNNTLMSFISIDRFKDFPSAKMCKNCQKQYFKQIKKQAT